MEEYVLFDTAKLAKEKGFNEFCRKVFNTEGKSSNLSGYMQMMKWNINDKVHLYDTDSEEFEYPDIECTQPTQSQLAKWLRDKYYLHPYIVAYFGSEYDHGIQGWELLSIQFLKDEKNQPDRRRFETYEDCLEYGLIICLKSI